MIRSRITLPLMILVALFVSGVVFAGQPTPPAEPPTSEDGGQAGQSGDQSGQAGQVGGGHGHGCDLITWIKNVFKKKQLTPEEQAEAMKKLLEIVASDLDLCLATLDGKQVSYLKMFPAIGHLNHALGALNKIEPPKQLQKALKEVHKRISHCKFYLVMKDVPEAQNRVTATLEFVKTLQN